MTKETKEDSQEPVLEQNEIPPDSAGDLEDFYGKPVLIGLGLFVLLLIPLIVNNVALQDVPVQSAVQITPEKNLKAIENSTQKKNQNIARIDRVGEGGLNISGVETTNIGCQYALDASQYGFLSEESMSKRGLSGISPLTVTDKGTELKYNPKGIDEGCSSSFSFAKDKILISPAQESEDLKGFSVQLSSRMFFDSSAGELLWVYPKTRLRVKIAPASIPDGKQTLVVHGIYLGTGKINTQLHHGNQKLDFIEKEGRLTVELEYQPGVKWSFIISSKRDFLLIDYIGFRDQEGKIIVVKGRK